MPMNARLLRPTASGFNPRSISGLALWLDAADGSTLFQNSDGTTPATATSDPVGYWGDKSGNGRHATQATAASRPTISGTALNGRRQLSFVSQNLRGPSSTFTGSVTAYWVGRTNQASGGAFVFSDGTQPQTDAFHTGWLNTQGVGAFGNGWGSGNSPRAESPLAWRSADIVAGITLSSDEALARVNGATVNTTAALTGTLSQASAAQFAIGTDTSGWPNLNGNLAELLIYQPALTAAQRARVETYLARRWGITLAPTATNPEAVDWINRVYANGGTVSTSTANAVDAFCNAIDAAGIRDRFYRLNLFAGTGLNAALVPLYRGPSLTGTQYGNTTDTNNGPFGSGDYSESSGLTGNGTNQYLDTGLDVDELPGAADCHLSGYIRGTQSIAAVRTLVGTLFNGVTDRYRIYLNTSTAGNYAIYTELGKTNVIAASRPNANGGLILSSRTSTTSLTLYDDAVSIGTNTTLTAETTGAAPFFVFARNGPTEYYNGIMAGYSIGGGMSGAEVTAYYNAMNTFQTALGREQA